MQKTFEKSTWLSVAFAALVSLTVSTGHAAQGESSKTAAPAVVIDFTTDSFEPGKSIPKKYTADGIDGSVNLKWGKLPAQARSLALVVDDPDAPSGTWVHWLVWDIPVTLSNLKEAITSKELADLGIKQGKNSFGRNNYNGPSPPPGKTHRYFFKLYVLSAKLNLPEGASKTELMDAISKCQLAHTQIMGTYSR